MCNSEFRALNAHPVPDGDIAAHSRTVSAKLRRPEVNRSYVVPVLAKALRVMRLLEAAQRPMTVTQVCEATGIAQTTVYRILRTLSAYGYVPLGDHGVYAFRVPSQEGAATDSTSVSNGNPERLEELEVKVGS